MRLCLVSHRASWDICKNVWKMLNIPTCRTRDRAHISSASRIWLITVPPVLLPILKTSQQYFLPSNRILIVFKLIYLLFSPGVWSVCVCADHWALVTVHWFIITTVWVFAWGQPLNMFTVRLTAGYRTTWHLASFDTLRSLHWPDHSYKARHKWSRCVSAAVWSPLNMYGGVSSNEDEMHASNPAICMFYKLFYRGRVRMNTAEHWAHGAT